MDSFKKGDILEGKEREDDKAKHFIVFISGSKEIPNGVILTHTTHKREVCNFRLSGKYKLSNKDDNRDSYFAAHLIEKVVDWGPYLRINEVSGEDLMLIESSIKGAPMTWGEYLRYKGNSCPEHNSN